MAIGTVGAAVTGSPPRQHAARAAWRLAPPTAPFDLPTDFEGPSVLPSPRVPSIELINATCIPQLGFGTLSLSPSDGSTGADATLDAVGQALMVGYRHLDTAQSYGTELGVGRAVTRSGISRGDVYLTTKLGNAHHAPEDVHRSFAESVRDLDVDYVDLFLMHWPLPMLYGGHYVSTWQAMTEVIDTGRLHSVGVSNFEPEHLQCIVSATGVVPVVNQIEVHPYFRNDAARTASMALGVVVEAWSPLGRGAVLEDPVIDAIASAVGRSPAQVVLRWHIQHGHIIIPKSTHRNRMKENFAIFDFALSADDMAAIDALDRGERGRTGGHPNTFARVP